MIGLIILAVVWALLWVVHGCTVEMLLKEILAALVLRLR